MPPIPSYIMADKFFEWQDYFIFSCMLFLSAFIGVYFAFFAKKKQDTPLEYLSGGKTMGVFPISMSLIASYISGISLIGIPAEIYVYGAQYWVVIISEYLVCITIAFFYLPVFYKLQVTSAYEYLKLRFNGKVRILGCSIFIIKMLLMLPVMVYVPALSLSQVTGISLFITRGLVCLICIFYTSIGGFKAVVWTNTIHLGAMVFGIVAVLVVGVAHVGFDSVITRNKYSQRLEFNNFDTDPTVRHTVWGLVIGNYFSWMADCIVNQSVVQSYLAIPSRKKANLSIFFFAIGITFLVSACCIIGLVIYAYYHDCDPLSTKKIKKSDQILPYFVMEIGTFLPGLYGIFISGAFSATLSDMSSGLNSMTAVIFEDLVRPMIGPISESRATFLMKIIVVLIGFFCMLMTFIVNNLGTLIQAGKSFGGITTGSLLGMFTLGMFFPWANAEGAFAGGLCSLAITTTLSLISQILIANGDVVYPEKPVNIDGCPTVSKDFKERFLWNFLVRQEINYERDPYRSSSYIPWLLRISYLWYTLIGVLIVLIVGMIISYLTGFNKSQQIDKDLITPALHKFVPEIKESTPRVKAKVKVPKHDDDEIGLVITHSLLCV